MTCSFDTFCRKAARRDNAVRTAEAMAKPLPVATVVCASNESVLVSSCAEVLICELFCFDIGAVFVDLSIFVLN